MPRVSDIFASPPACHESFLNAHDSVRVITYAKHAGEKCSAQAFIIKLLHGKPRYTIELCTLIIMAWEVGSSKNCIAKDFKSFPFKGVNCYEILGT